MEPIKIEDFDCMLSIAADTIQVLSLLINLFLTSKSFICFEGIPLYLDWEFFVSVLLVKSIFFVYKNYINLQLILFLRHLNKNVIYRFS